MAVLMLISLAGDPDRLATSLREHLEPVMDRVAVTNGARWHSLSKNPDGVLIADIWDDPAGMDRTMSMPEVREAMEKAALPQPRIEVHELVMYKDT